ncbi:hypothetical protein ACFQVD_26700 [Streptosporangium amethystogenes subsp. fukuiense]|uniref:DUF3085 domain-containing protein n=1 Tax=Streptosporangium amethystogenes subsp. fukuiense TaxID=698418 RepID=A0ABW2T5L3_9ACTN
MSARHLADVLPEPADGSVLVVHVGDTYAVIERDDATAAECTEHPDERWFDASDPDADPVTWRAALDYADEVLPLGTALASLASDAPSVASEHTESAV